MHFSFHVGLNTVFNSVFEQQTYSPLYVVQIKELPSGERKKMCHLYEILFNIQIGHPLMSRAIKCQCECPSLLNYIRKDL